MLARVGAITLTRGEPFSQNYTWGDEGLTTWTGRAYLRRLGETLAEFTVTLGDAGLITIALTDAQTSALPETGPAHRAVRLGDWDIVLTSPTGVKYRPFGGPVLIIAGA
jgi:hypothetical protein